MPERRPPHVTDATPIGPDVNLDDQDIRLTDGSRLTHQAATQIVADARHSAGRPSLTGPGKHSPQVSARVPAELREAAEQRARSEGKSVSQLIRELLERHLMSELVSARHGP
jgi:hypothetical protein